MPIQDAVESRVARIQVGDAVDVRDPAFQREALRWTLLAQFDTDRTTGMDWGRGNGSLYWMIRSDDLAARRFDAAVLMEQH